MTAGLHIKTVCFDTQHLNSKTRVTADCATTKFQLVMVASHLRVAIHLLTCGRVMAVSSSMYIQLSSSRSSTSCDDVMSRRSILYVVSL